jgi:hypothetical protein
MMQSCASAAKLRAAGPILSVGILCHVSCRFPPLRGRRIGAAPWVEMGLRQLLIEAGVDLERERVTIAPVPGASGAGVINFGLTAAKALEDASSFLLPKPS